MAEKSNRMTDVFTEEIEETLSSVSSGSVSSVSSVKLNPGTIPTDQQNQLPAEGQAGGKNKRPDDICDVIRPRKIMRWERSTPASASPSPSDAEENAFKESKSRTIKEAKEKGEFLKNMTGRMHELKMRMLTTNFSFMDDMSAIRSDMNEHILDLDVAQSEVRKLKIEVAEQTSRAEQCTSLKNQLQTQSLELQHVTSELKKIETERDSYKDWQQQAKTRLTNMEQLEKEVVRLRETERCLRDSLEELVPLLKSMVEVLRPAHQELHEAKVKIASLEGKLEDGRALSIALDTALNRATTTSLEKYQHLQTVQRIEELYTTANPAAEEGEEELYTTANPAAEEEEETLSNPCSPRSIE